MTLVSIVVNGNAQSVPLKPAPPPPPPVGDYPKGKHAPANYPDVFACLDANASSISIDATVFDSEYITVTIYDEDDNVVLSGSYSSSTVFGINLGSLSTGSYTIKLEIDGYSYYYEGEFEL